MARLECIQKQLGTAPRGNTFALGLLDVQICPPAQTGRPKAEGWLSACKPLTMLSVQCCLEPAHLALQIQNQCGGL